MVVPPKLALGHRIAPPRFLAFLAISIIGFLLAGSRAEWSHAVLVGFDAGALFFLISCIPLLDNATDKMRAAAERNDANRAFLLGLTGLVSAVVLVAVAVELSQRKELHGASIALVIVTLLLAWLFSNLIYALHYAHLFYSRGPDGEGDAGGLNFSGDYPEPDYWDFIYFAFTLGMTFQTSDTGVSSSRMRRIVTFHCLAAFVFNIGVLAFTINTLGGGS